MPPIPVPWTLGAIADNREEIRLPCAENSHRHTCRIVGGESHRGLPWPTMRDLRRFDSDGPGIVNGRIPRAVRIVTVTKEELLWVRIVDIS